MPSEPLPRQETAKLATESFGFADVDPLVDQMKTRWGMKLYSSHCSVSEMSKENTTDSPDIFVVERNWHEVSTKSLLLKIKQIWQDEMHLAVGDHVVVKQDKKWVSHLQKKRTDLKVLQLNQTSEPWKNSV